MLRNANPFEGGRLAHVHSVTSTMHVMAVTWIRILVWPPLEGAWPSLTGPSLQRLVKREEYTLKAYGRKVDTKQCGCAILRNPFVDSMKCPERSTTVER